MAAQENVTGEIEAAYEADGSETDSLFSEANSSTQSITSSIYDHERTHGRTFHAYHAGKYWMPNDEPEQERIDLTYHAVRLALQDKLFYAPVKNPLAILDVGTGTGIWCMDVADTYPAAHVIGIDLSPIQPNYVPTNLEFEIADADEDWTFSQKFDLIYTRLLNDYTLKDWPHFYREAFKSLRPGGWVEGHEFSYIRQSDDDSLPADSCIAEWERKWTEGINRAGLPGPCDPTVMTRQMMEAGFVNITVLNLKWPVGPWPKDPKLKECGLFTMAMLIEHWYGLSVKVFTQSLGWTNEELEILLAECRYELRKKSIHGYWPLYVVYGQKPRNSMED